MSFTIFAILFGIVIIGQIYFLGKYISISQGMFLNKEFATFSLGGATYFLLSFIMIAPFAWLKLNIIYFAVLIAIKDFFTVTFLIARREIFRGMKVNYKAVLFIVAAGITGAIITEFVLQYIWEEKPYAAQASYHLIHIYTDSTEKLTNTSHVIDISYIINPIAYMIIFSIVASLGINFSKSDTIFEYIISFIVFVGGIFLLQEGNSAIMFLGSVWVLMMFFVAYHLIVFSRRRYGSVFSILVLVAWGTNPSLFWVLFAASLAVATTYSLLRRPRAPLFFIQLIVPALLISTVWITETSTMLAWALFIIGIISYVSIFLLSSGNWFDRNEKKYEWIRYVGPIVIFITLMGTSIGLGYKYLEDGSFWTESFDVIGNYGNDTARILSNASYYGMTIAIIFYSIFWIVKGEKLSRWKIIVIISFMVVLFGFNPIVKALLTYLDIGEQFVYLKFAVLPPIFISVLFTTKDWIIRKRTSAKFA